MGEGSTRFLVVVAASRASALPLAHVVEVMRPLPVEPLLGTPDYVLGVAVIRGAPMPVVNLASLLVGGTHHNDFRRFVTVKAAERRFALAVDDVVGVRVLDDTEFGDLPPLLRHGDVDLIDAVGVVDAHLLVVLQSARIIDGPLWKKFDERAEAR
jgi:purine-binding chemotaxis protein CheW